MNFLADTNNTRVNERLVRSIQAKVFGGLFFVAASMTGHWDAQ